MGKIFIVLAAHAVFATAAFAQTAPAAFADATQKALVQQYCEKDPRFMQCLGVDVRKEGARCADLMRSNWAFCRSTFMMTAPASVSAADARSHSDNLEGCMRTGAIAATGKAAGAVEACMTGAK